MVWTSTEERGWVYWENDSEDGVARKEETGKAKKEVYGCGEREDMAEVEVMREEPEANPDGIHVKFEKCQCRRF